MYFKELGVRIFNTANVTLLVLGTVVLGPVLAAEKKPIYNPNNLICSADSNESYFVDEIRVTKRDQLLSSINERIIKSCEMDVVEVNRRLLSKNLVLVDVRPTKEFNSYRISNSVNMSKYEIKSKEFLKSKHVIIVGNRGNIVDMGLLCHELKQKGFKKVNFLKGGVGSWEEKIIGDKKDSFERWVHGRISTRKFISLKSKIKWLVLDTSNDIKVSNYLNISMSDMQIIQLNINNPVSLDIIKEHMKVHENSSMHGVIAVSKFGEKYGAVDDLLSSNNIKNSYYLDGGVEAYEKFNAEREGFLSRLKRGAIKPSPCSNV